jgi:ferredoxin
MAKRITVDPAACDGFGFCAGILPDMIGRDEWGFPVVVPGPVPAALAKTAQRAVRFCPRQALHLEETSDDR